MIWRIVMVVVALLLTPLATATAGPPAPERCSDNLYASPGWASPSSYEGMSGRTITPLSEPAFTSLDGNDALWSCLYANPSRDHGKWAQHPAGILVDVYVEMTGANSNGELWVFEQQQSSMLGPRRLGQSYVPLGFSAPAIANLTHGSGWYTVQTHWATDGSVWLGLGNYKYGEPEGTDRLPVGSTYRITHVNVDYP